ncbi:MAG: hypothetical protein DRJ44_03875 [Thermoprotei archaeon]|nr:MAG: hypothetical protein DRJ44_03875 [Thermoprotei archaeon]
MAKVDWVWYHKQDVSSTGDVTYFNTDQATAGINTTNMKMAGQLPAAEKFTIHRIDILIDEAASAADIAALEQDTVVELIIGETTIITAPLYLFKSNYNNYTWEFKNPISLPGGVGFKVLLHVGTAPSAATSVTVSLVGVREY